MSANKLPEDTTESLAFDVAVGFFDNEQLAIRYGLAVDEIENIQNQTAFRREVDEQKRLLTEDGSGFKARAREYAMKALDFYHELIDDEDAPYTARAKAADKLVEWAGYQYMKPKSEGGGGQVQLVINTNLGLGSSDTGQGNYVIEAEPVSEEDDGRDLIE